MKLCHFLKYSAKSLMVTLLMVLSDRVSGQVDGPGGTTSDGRQGGYIVSGVPFLLVSPDARSGALGDAGVALSEDVNAVYWNPAKLAFIEANSSLGLSYSPWLRKLVPDVNLAYLSFIQKVDEDNAFGASLRYFNLGQIERRDDLGNPQGTFSPSEFSVDGTFARRFGENFSLGTSLRFIYSNLSNGGFSDVQQIKAGTAVAADVSMFYKNEIELFGTDAIFAFGTNISNIGTKISYSDNGPKYFLPTNLRIGAANTWLLNDLNELTFTVDLNKLLVPTQPLRDSVGNIVAGKDPDRSVPAGIFGSFSDAPGGLREEMKEISYSAGLEYWYDKQFALRAGYFYESPEKGDRQYLSLGAGFRYDKFRLDFSYLVANQQKSPIANTLRFSLLFNFGSELY
jgi:hypothetical protein